MAAEAIEQLATALESGRVTSLLSPTDQAMLDYAVKLTRQPAAIGLDDIDRLRDAGLDDRAIHDLCAIVAYFAFANRIASGLGIEVEKPS
jgi:uncharacterized peroxidase-related enzyme